VFVGEFAPEAVAWTGRTLGFSDTESFESLEVLLDSGLVQRVSEWEQDPRYRMLETIREYGLEQLELSVELEDARLSHARCFASFANEGAPLPAMTVLPGWYLRRRLENADLIAAFDYACDSGPIELCVELASIAGAYWDRWGPHNVGSERLLKAVERWPGTPSLPTVHAMYWTAVVTMFAGDIDRARQIGESALAMARQLGDRHSEAAMSYNLGWGAELSGKWTEAKALFDQAEAHWIALGEVGARGMIYMLLGGHAYVQGDYAEARRLEEVARTILADIGNEWVAGTEWYLGFIDIAEGKIFEAAVHFQRALQMWLGFATRTHHFKAVIHLADVAATIGEWETATTLAGCCDHILETTGSSLFPFDVPVWERATTRCRAALGDKRFDALHSAARGLGPADWLDLAQLVVDTSAIWEKRRELV